MNHDLIVNALNIQREIFEGDFGLTVLPIDVYLDEASEIHCDSLPGVYIGCFYCLDGPINVIIGDYCEVPAFYHELIHWMLAGHDVMHTDTRWEYWNERQQNINENIRASHEYLRSR